MALFVAKFFEQSAPAPRTQLDEIDDVSPVLRAAVAPLHRARERETIQTKIAKVLRKHKEGPPTKSRPSTEDLETMLQNKLLTARSSASATAADPRWNAGVIGLIQSVRLPPHQLSPEEMIESTVSQLKDKMHLVQLELEATRAEEQRIRESLNRESTRMIGQHPRLLPKLSAIESDISAIDSHIAVNREWIRKGKFVESLLTCVRLTDWLNKLQPDQYLGRSIEIVQALSSVGILRQSLQGRSRSVIDDRLAILTNRVTLHLISLLHEEHQVKEAYGMLKLFLHAKENFATQEALFHKKLKMFNHLFVRPESALNLLDKPEWPLRWFQDTCQDMIEVLGEGSREELSTFMSHQSKVYFRKYRWGTADDSVVFSLCLAKYLHAAANWRESFGEGALKEFMSDMTENHMQILDRWIEHDKAHIENAIEATKNPYDASQFNQRICNLVQTLLDLMDSSAARLESLRHNKSAIMYFIENCHDAVIRDLMQKLRIDSRDELSSAQKDLLRESLESLVDSVTRTTLSSSRIRKQMLDLINQI